MSASANRVSRAAASGDGSAATVATTSPEVNGDSILARVATALERIAAVMERDADAPLVAPTLPKVTPEVAQELREERAAIMEFDAGLPRAEAEAKAAADVATQVVEDVPPTKAELDGIRNLAAQVVVEEGLKKAGLDEDCARRLVEASDDVQDARLAQSVRICVAGKIGFDAFERLRDAAGIKRGQCPTAKELRRFVLEFVAKASS